MAVCNHHTQRTSFQAVFWKSQFHAMQQKSSTCIRWHPTMIKWCHYLNHKFSTAYNLLRSSKVIQLPSQRTLRDYSHHYKSSSGFSVELDNQLMTEFSTTTEEYQRHVSLIGDEMYIKESLVYSKASGELVGFCDIGDINNHLLQLEQKYQKDEDTHLKFAKTVLVIMIRGLFTDITFPYATFPATNLTGEQLIPIFLESIMKVETCGLRVTSITLDGSSVNRKFFKIIAAKNQYKFPNPATASNNKRDVYLFSDPLLLIKTARNCLANPKRNMQVCHLLLHAQKCSLLTINSVQRKIHIMGPHKAAIRNVNHRDWIDHCS